MPPDKDIISDTMTACKYMARIKYIRGMMGMQHAMPYAPPSPYQTPAANSDYYTNYLTDYLTDYDDFENTWDDESINWDFILEEYLALRALGLLEFSEETQEFYWLDQEK